MDENLRLLFDRALADEPEPPTADLAGQVMAIGLRRRRRRLAVAGGAGLALVAALSVANLATSPPGAPPLETVPARFAGQLNPICESPARNIPTDISVFLTMDVTDEQRVAVDELLRTEPSVSEVAYESRDAAYATFISMFSDKPEIIGNVGPSHFPESFRIKVDDGSRWAQLDLRIERTPGVDEVIGSACPTGVSVGVAG